jgi:hypothetical protein
VVGSLLGEEEMEEEHEHELEHEISPIRKIYPDAMMEHLGELAAEAETEEEAAEHFLPLIGMAASKLLPVVARAAAPLARKLLPKVARVVTGAAPRLTKGIGQVARTLHRNPQTRHLLKTVPAIARRTVNSLAHQAARGRTVTPGHVVPGGAAPVTYQGGAIVPRPGVAPVRYGRIVDGRCTCPACPAAGPQYCRCCGQLLR